MARRQVTHGQWTLPSWSGVAALAGERMGDPSARGVLVRSDDEVEQYLYSGFRVELYRDNAEGYWFNLAGKEPALYILCHEPPDGGIEPFSVTADPNEASAAVEGDDKVFAVPMPPEVFRQIEEFVVKYYVPREPGKRKRKDWTREQGNE